MMFFCANTILGIMLHWAIEKEHKKISVSSLWWEEFSCIKQRENANETTLLQKKFRSRSLKRAAFAFAGWRVRAICFMAWHKCIEVLLLRLLLDFWRNNESSKIRCISRFVHLFRWTKVLLWVVKMTSPIRRITKKRLDFNETSVEVRKY